MKTIHKIYLILAFFATTALLLAIFLIYPIFKSIKDGSSKILSYQEESVLIDMESRELDNFKKRYKEYEPNFKRVDQVFVDAKNPVDFVRFLENTAYSLNLKSEISLSQSSKNNVAVFSMRLKGDFSNLLHFSEKLETGPYLITIKNVSVKKLTEVINDKEKNALSQVDASFSIEVITN